MISHSKFTHLRIVRSNCLREADNKKIKYRRESERFQSCLLTCHILPVSGNRLHPAEHVPHLLSQESFRAPTLPFFHRTVFSLVPAASSQPTPCPSTQICKRALKLLWQSWSGIAVSLSGSGSGSSPGWHSLLSLSCLTHCMVDPDRSNTLCIYRGHQYTFYVCYKSQFSVVWFFGFFFFTYALSGKNTFASNRGAENAKFLHNFLLFVLFYQKNPKR